MLLIGLLGLVFVTALFFLLCWLIDPTLVNSILKRESTDTIDVDQMFDDFKDVVHVKADEGSEELLASSGSPVFSDQSLYSDNKGSIGEIKVAKVLSGLDRNQYYTINNLLLQVNGSTVQIDHVVVSVYGIFVIETKNYRGVIYGGQNSENWDQYIYSNKYQFRNPILQNLGHIGALKYTICRNDDIFVPIVVFTGDCVLKVKAPNCSIIQLSALTDKIISYKQPILSVAEASSISQQLAHANKSSPENDTKHIEEVKRKTEDAEKSIRSGICPRCGSELVMKTEGYQTFMVCRNYPKCGFSTKAR